MADAYALPQDSEAELALECEPKPFLPFVNPNDDDPF